MFDFVIYYLWFVKAQAAYLSMSVDGGCGSPTATTS